TTQRIDLVVIDFREDDLLFHAHAVVAAAIKGLGTQAAEVANPRQGDGKQTIQEFVHAIATQRHLDADWPAFADLEASDGVPGVGHYDLLTGDLLQVGNSMIDDLLVTDGFAATHIAGALGDPRNFHHVAQLQFFLQLGSALLPINFSYSCHGYLPSSLKLQPAFGST